MNCVAVSGDFAYVGGDNGLTVVNMSVTGFPIVGTREIPIVEEEPGSYTIWAIAVAGSRVYAAAEEAGLVVIDTADPSYPSVMGGTAIPGTPAALGVTLVGAYALVANGGLQIIDLLGQ